MKRAKVVTQMLGAKEDMMRLQEIFGMLSDQKSGDPQIILMQYIPLRNNLIQLCRAINVLVNFTEFVKTFPYCEEGIADLRKFVDKAKEALHISEIKEESEAVHFNQKYKPEILLDLNFNLKNSEAVKQAVVTSGNIYKYNKQINEGKDSFILQEPGLSYTPLSFSCLDLKRIWLDPLATPVTKKFLLNILSHINRTCFDIYDITTKPNINVQEFGSLLVEKMCELKSQMHGCDDAFKILASSVNLFENNFDKYYKASIEAGNNPTVIAPNFVLDIINEHAHEGLKVRRQFKRIFMHISKSANVANNPKAQELLRTVQHQYNVVEASIEAEKRKGIDVDKALAQPPTKKITMAEVQKALTGSFMGKTEDDEEDEPIVLSSSVTSSSVSASASSSVSVSASASSTVSSSSTTHRVSAKGNVISDMMSQLIEPHKPTQEQSDDDSDVVVDLLKDGDEKKRKKKKGANKKHATKTI